MRHASLIFFRFVGCARLAGIGLALAAVFFTAPEGYSQAPKRGAGAGPQGRISGMLRAAGNGQPVANAQLKLEGPGLAAVENSQMQKKSGADGAFQFDAPPGPYDLWVIASGFEDLKLNVELTVDRPVVRAWRLTPNRGGKTVEIEVSSPLGIARAWVGDDPLMKSEATLESPDPCTVRIRFDGSKGQQREVYVQPMGDLLAATAQASVRVPRAGMEAVPLKALPMDGEGEMLAELRVSGVSVQVNYAAVPVPLGRAVSGMDEEMASDLEALGYVEREESAPELEPRLAPAPTSPASPASPAGCAITAPAL